MASLEHEGVRVLELSDLDQIAGDRMPAGWPTPTPNVVHVDPEGQDWDLLRSRDLVLRPNWVTWLAAASNGSAGLISTMSRKRRYLSRTSLRRIGDLTMQVSDPIEPDLLDAWMVCYTSRVATMRHGVNIALAQREQLLDPASGHKLVVWRDGVGLVCGCVVREDRERDTLYLRFSVVDPRVSGQELARAMYLSVADLAGGLGFARVSLGNDINFFGAVVKPGLCSFKLRLGFRPVPSHTVDEIEYRTVAEKVVNLDGLDVPVLCFEYTHAASPFESANRFLGEPNLLRLVSVSPASPPHDERVNRLLTSLPAHRRLTLGG